MPCNIDVSKAVAKLGLKKPVSFAFMSLNDADNPLVASLIANGVAGARTAPFPGGHHEIQVDLDAIKFGEVDIRDVIAHELIHCQQFERAGSFRRATLKVLRDQVSHSYEDNPGELDAERRKGEIRDLITVSGCGSRFPVTATEVKRGGRKYFGNLLGRALFGGRIRSWKQPWSGT